MKTSIVAVCLVVAGLTAIGLLTPGCGGGDDTTVVTNVVAAPLPAEIILDSKTLNIAASGGTADTTPAATPTNGVVTATVTWSGGSNLVAALFKDGVVQAIVADTSPLVVSGNASAGSSWYVHVSNNNSVAITVNMVVSLTP